ncbi:lipocalin-like domain-containing protein [Nevskia soli]|uniref:lipocalin-like domain-containing protein n=1 Tax=Nevskia soli TaxID=418856 RepID=UPI00068D74DA|nr:lipocalin-like domain-containing protein [Nevskia soli]
MSLFDCGDIHQALPGPLARALVGLWVLERYSETDETGTERLPFGSAAEGFLIYTVDGFMSVQLMKPGRPPLGHGAWGQGHGEPYEAIASGYIAYCGQYRVDEPRAEVAHLVVVALTPNLIGQPQRRTVEMANDRLVLSAGYSRPDGGTVGSRLQWRRKAELIPVVSKCKQGDPI